MLKIIKDRWNERQDILRQKLIDGDKFNSCGYKDIVELTFDVMFNYEGAYPALATNSITEIDDGDYQGTLLYLIPFETYQPDASRYLLTHVGYGSCSGCDTLQAIQDWSDNTLTEEQIRGFMTLCKDILVNTIKPYNYGWREDDKFLVVEDDA